MSARRYELTDFEWSIIEPLLPDKPRGVVVRMTACFEWYLLAAQNGFAIGGHSGALWAGDDLLQSLRPVAESRRLGSDFRSCFLGLRRRSANAGQFLDPRASARGQRQKGA